MKKLKTVAVAMEAAVLFLAAVHSVSQTAEATGPPRDPVVAEFAVSDVPAIEALLQLSRTQHLPIGIVAQGKELCDAHVSYSATNERASSIAEAIAAQVAGHAAIRRPGSSVIVIAPVSPNHPTSEFLGLIDPRYTVNGNLQTLATMLWVHVLAMLHPDQGSAGSILGSPSDRLFRIDLTNVSIEQILDRIALETRGAWALRPLPVNLKQLGAESPFEIFSGFGQYRSGPASLCVPVATTEGRAR
jgi:hypothetical protein